MLNKQIISLDTLIEQGHSSIVSDMDGEKVMMSIVNGKYYNLGLVGGRIWDQINEPISVRELVRLLTLEFDVDYSQCQEQVSSFIEVLYKEGLIKVHNELSV